MQTTYTVTDHCRDAQSMLKIARERHPQAYHDAQSDGCPDSRQRVVCYAMRDGRINRRNVLGVVLRSHITTTTEE